MNFRWLILFVSAPAFAVGGCTTTGAFTPTGLAAVSIYTEPVLVTTRAVETKLKKGTACTMNILGIVAIGEGGIDEAMRDGDITKVVSVDRRVTNILLLYGSVCTIVRGT